MTLGPTPSQTVGPFFSIGLDWAPDGHLVVPEGTPGAIRIGGRIVDGAGAPVPDAVVESWQADPDGRFAHPDDPRGAVAWRDFRGFARAPTDDDGRFSLLTVKPGPLPDGDGGLQAPHLLLSVLMRGQLQRLVTRIYFPDEEEANAADPVLRSLAPDAARTLVAVAERADALRFDICLQGPHETAFFRV